jgi:hypothetical protein
MVSDYAKKYRQRMKEKLSSKDMPRAGVPSPTPSPPANSQGEAIPLGLEYFEKLKNSPPREYFEELFPKLKNANDDEAKQFIEALAGMLSGLPGTDFGVEIPEWVKKASRKCLELTGIDFDGLKNGNISTKEIGKIFGLMEIPLGYEPPPKIKEAAANLTKLGRAEAAKASSREAKEFFTELDNAEKAADRLKTPPKRIKIFMIIAAAWRQVETFENAGQLHRWLEEIDAFDGSITDPAETRKICRLVGLNLRDKAGRPFQK